jgi:succinoglycan biosynthesis transport protein ExoP
MPQASVPNPDDSAYDLQDAPDQVAGPDRAMRTQRFVLDLLGRWYWIVLGCVIGLLISAYYVSKAPRTYSATSTLLFKQSGGSLIRPGQTDAGNTQSEEGINTVAERIRRYEVLFKVASRPDVRTLPGITPQAIDWYPEWFSRLVGRKPAAASVPAAATPVAAPPPEPAVIAGWLGSWLSVSPRGATRLLDVTVVHHSPEVARSLADAVVREYVAEATGSLAKGRRDRMEALLRQSEEARLKLQEAETASAIYARALESLNAHDERERQHAQLRRRYLPKHPKMAAATADLDVMRTRFLDEFALARASQADASYWRNAGKEMDAAGNDPRESFRVARQLLLARTGVLRGEINSQMSVFNAMLTAIEESNVNSENVEPNVEISNFASLPGWPSSPNVRKIYSSGIFRGLTIGLLLAVALIFLDNRFHMVAQVEAETGLPVLAAIPQIELRFLEQAEKEKLAKGNTVEIPPEQAKWDPMLLFRAGTSSTSFAETFRVLRASVSLLGDESKRRVTLFTSALPGEGKSLISVNFAMANAAQGRRTLLLDLDLRKPAVHGFFGIHRKDQGPGATDWLAGRASLEEIVRRDLGVPDLDVVLCGAKAPSPGELLHPGRLAQFFAEAAAKYDAVVIDSAPLLAVPDTRVIAPLVHNICLVVRAGYVPKGAVTRSFETLAACGCPPSGIVFNCFRESRWKIGQNYSYGYYRISRYGRPYYYGYGSYGAYGEGDEGGRDSEKRRKRRKSRKT